MSKEIVDNMSAEQTLPDHITIGLHDEASQVVDEFIVDAHLRIVHENESIPADASIEEKLEIIKTAMKPDARPPVHPKMTEEQKEFRRAEIYAREQRRRQFGRPILRFDTIHYPHQRD